MSKSPLITRHTGAPAWVNCASLWGCLLHVPTAVVNGERFLHSRALLDYCGLARPPALVTLLQLDDGVVVVSEIDAAACAVTSPLEEVRLAVLRAAIATPTPTYNAPSPAGYELDPTRSVRSQRRAELVREVVAPRKRPLTRGKHPALLFEFGCSPLNGSSPEPSTSLDALLLPGEASSGSDRDHSLEEFMRLGRLLTKDIRRRTTATALVSWANNARKFTYKWLREVSAGESAGRDRAGKERVLRLTLMVPSLDGDRHVWLRHSLAWWRLVDGAWMLQAGAAPGVKRARMTPPVAASGEQLTTGEGQADDRRDDDEDESAE